MGSLAYVAFYVQYVSDIRVHFLFIENISVKVHHILLFHGLCTAKCASALDLFSTELCTCNTLIERRA